MPNWFRLSVGACTSLFCCTFKDLLFSVTMLAFSLPLTDFTGNLLILVLWEEEEEAEAAAAAAAAASAAWQIDEIVVREGASAADRMLLVVFVKNDDGDVVEDEAVWWLSTTSSSSSLWCVSFVTYKHGVDLGTFILFMFNAAAVVVRWWDWEWFVVFVVFVLLSILERFLYISVRFSPKLLAFIVALAHFSSGSVLSIIWSSFF